MTTLHSEFIPAQDKKSRRLMVMLHGLGDSIEGYRWFPEALALPWLNFLLVNAPDEYYGGFSWFDLDDMAPGVSRSRETLFALLNGLAAKNFPPEQITLGGFSQGCLMTIEVGIRYPHRLAGLVGISGWVFEPVKLLAEMPPIARQQRLLCTHGPFDTMVPMDRAYAHIQRLQTAGLNVEWREFPKAHTIYGEEELAVIRKFVNAGYPAVVGG